MIEDDIAAVRAGRGTPDQQMTVVSILDALLRPSKLIPSGIQPATPYKGSQGFYEPPPARGWDGGCCIPDDPFNAFS